MSCLTQWLCFLDKLAKHGWEIGSWGSSSTLRRWLMLGREKAKQFKNTNTNKSLMQKVTEREKEKKPHPPSKLCTARANLLLPPALNWLTHVTETQPYQVFRTVLLLGGDHPKDVTILHWASVDCNSDFIQNAFDICTYTNGSDLLLPLVPVCRSNNAPGVMLGPGHWTGMLFLRDALAWLSAHTEKLPCRIIVRVGKTGW